MRFLASCVLVHRSWGVGRGVAGGAAAMSESEGEAEEEAPPPVSRVRDVTRRMGAPMSTRRRTRLDAPRRPSCLRLADG